MTELKTEMLYTLHIIMHTVSNIGFMGKFMQLMMNCKVTDLNELICFVSAQFNIRQCSIKSRRVKENGQHIVFWRFLIQEKIIKKP
jgi:hypothetical protein